MHDRLHLTHAGSRLLLTLIAAALAALAVGAPTARAAAPANDDFASAQELAGESGTVGGTNVGATRESGEPARGLGFASVWYRWTAPFTGLVAFDTCVDYSFDTLLAVYSGGTLAGLERLAANDDYCDLGSRVVVSVEAGGIYHVAVDGFDGDTGSFTLRWRPLEMAAAPSNDAFAAARTLAGVRGRLLGTTVGATGESGEPAWMNRSSVWYRWRAPRTMPIVFSTCGASFDTLLGVYRGPTVGALTQLAWNDDACDLSSRVTLRAQAGQVYHVAVGALGEPGPFELRWEPAPCGVPALRGQTLARARVSLSQAGCSLGLVRHVRSPIAPRGAVVAQWPAPGTRLPYLGRVRVVVSRGSR